MAFINAFPQKIVHVYPQYICQLRKQGDIRVRQIALPFRNSFISDVQLLGKLTLCHVILCPKGADIGSECRLYHLYAPPAQNNIIREAPEQSTVGLPVMKLDYFSTNLNLL
jgi:hypothetical protein